ncbi:MAG: aminotransferase class I/II-fold pyridoxal phosphate-dependent enzyme [Pseudomonadaceae bacterium]|nr:aminotransferase class I/II-fold pyridoxal phosphate-dependent enzyme [Pseudomonadaceae bacterium]
MTMKSLSAAELAQLIEELSTAYERLQGNNLKLDLTRGKPDAQQLALSDALDGVLAGDYMASDGTDVRNYGGLLGLPETRALGAELMDTPADAIIAGGNSSLQLMFITLELALHQGLGNLIPWAEAESPTILCPVPGYDRHFTVCEELGLAMRCVDMTETGPDMAQVARAVADPNVVGIWNVPKYSNPTGVTYSAETVEQMAQLPASAAADNFLVLWDNAYAVHDFAEPHDELASIHSAAAAAGTSDHIVQFASTSKITFAGAGVAFVASGEHGNAAIVKRLSTMTVGPDKVNQLRHARFLGGRLREHMAKHAELLAPKFACVEEKLSQELADLGIASWTKPNGGYFVSLDVMPGLARKIIAMAAGAGVTLTPAGATFPYGDDPRDRNIRIAPTYAPLADVATSLDILTLCVRLASARTLLEQMQ